MRQAAKLVQRPYSQLLIALRAELGEMTGRFHFHFLLGGTKRATQSRCRTSLNTGGIGLFGQGAISKCRPYDRSLAGVAYVTKCLNQGTWGANEYEVEKVQPGRHRDAVQVRVPGDSERGSHGDRRGGRHA